MTKHLTLLLFIGLAWGQDNCTASDGTEGIELWGNCYHMDRAVLILAGNDLTGFIPSEIGNLTNLTYLD